MAILSGASILKNIMRRALCSKMLDMFPRIKKVDVKDDLVLLVTFDDGTRVLYDLKDDVKAIRDFKPLQTEIDQSRTCIYWSDRIDLASDTILEYGHKIAN